MSFFKLIQKYWTGYINTITTSSLTLNRLKCCPLATCFAQQSAIESLYTVLGNTGRVVQFWSELLLHLLNILQHCYQCLEFTELEKGKRTKARRKKGGTAVNMSVVVQMTLARSAAPLGFPQIRP